MREVTNMETQYSLVSLFEENRQVLEEQLSGKSLPEDAKEVIKVVNSYFEKILGKENSFRQHLRQSEGYILDAAMSLLNAQQSMYGDIFLQEIKRPEPIELDPHSENLIPAEESKKSMTAGAVLGLGASCIGAGAYAIGASALGGLFVAITSAAIGLYCVSQLMDKQKSQNQRKELVSESSLPYKNMDVNRFLSIICNICKQIDDLMKTYRAQIEQVRNSYESMEKISLEKDYKLLLSSIQMMLGVSYEEGDTSEKSLKRLRERVEEVGESLENYGIIVVKYNDEVKANFEIVRRENIETPITLVPALMKNGSIILRGKVAIKR